VLQNNAGDDLSIAANGSFSFATQLASGAGYAVTVKSQSRILTRVCTVSNGTGTVANAAVVNVDVICAAPPVRYAYATNAGSNNLFPYTVDTSTGVLGSMAAPMLGTGSTPSGIVADPAGRFAYVANQGDNTVGAYSIGAGTGFLTRVAAVAAGYAPLSIVADPTGRFVYVVSHGVDSVSGFIMGYIINADTGKLTQMAGPQADVGRSPSAIALDSMGRFAYVTNGVDATVSVLSIDESTG